MINCSCLQCGGCSQLCDRNPGCDAFTTEGREAPIDADRRGPAIATLSVVTVVVQSQQSSECVVPGFAVSLARFRGSLVAARACVAQRRRVQDFVNRRYTFPRTLICRAW